MSWTASFRQTLHALCDWPLTVPKKTIPSSPPDVPVFQPTAPHLNALLIAQEEGLVEAPDLVAVPLLLLQHLPPRLDQGLPQSRDRRLLLAQEAL